MRLMQRTTVDLPEPDGPISAVAWLGANDSVRSLIECCSPYQAFSRSTVTERARRCGAVSAARATGRTGETAGSWKRIGSAAGVSRRTARGRDRSRQTAPSLDRRASRVSMRIIATSVKAAPHAIVTRRSCACPTFWKMSAGSEFMRSL